MAVKAKFRCNSITEVKYSTGEDYKPQRKIQMMAVYGKEGENADYSKATPSGNVEITIDPSTSAYDWFEPGKEYYLSFDKAE